jgi:hypothetical protein
MSTYSSNLKIELIGTGEQSGTWGATTNNNYANVFEQAIVGRGNPDFASDANLTLTYVDSVATQTARSLYLNVTSSVIGGLTATRDLIVPTINKTYVVENNTTGAQSIRVITAAGTGITIPNGRKAALYVDGTNVTVASDWFDINGGTIDGTVIGGVTPAAAAFTTAAVTTATVTTGNITTVNATNVNTTNLDLTNLEVTNIKAKDGTASATIADSTGVMTIASSVLTTTDINGGTIDNVTLGGTLAGTPSFSGNVVFSSTGAIKAPTGTTLQRPTAVTGMLRFNSSAEAFEGYDGSSWTSLGGAQGGTGNPFVYENDITVTANYTITTGKNAGSFGPLTINDGVTVTIPDGSTWSII